MQFWETWADLHTELTISTSTLLAFLLVLARVSGAFVFVPLPVKDVGPSIARIVMALAVTIALFPRWPSITVHDAGVGLLLFWVISEAALGAAIGLMVSFLTEAMTFGAQILGLQAGYGYASIVDPTTQADSEVLPVITQLTAGLLFFTMGLDRYVIRAFAESLDKYPAGTFVLKPDLSTEVIHLAGSVFSVGLRLAFPVLGLLFMTDIALALVGRINSQLHLSMHAFPVKMLMTLMMLGTVLAVSPQLYQAYAAEVFKALHHSFLP